MLTNKRVLIIGFDPQFLDFSSPELAPLNLTAEKINAATTAEFERLRGLGYEPDGCFVDLGETAEAILASRLREKEYGCVIIGAGVRANPKYLLDTLTIVSTVIVEHYSPLSFYSHVHQVMQERSDEVILAHLNEWLFDKTAIKLRATVDEYQPKLTLEEYAASLSDSPPSPERVNLLMRFVRANHVGDFFLGLDAAVRNAGNDILASLPGESTLLSPPSEEEIAEMARNYELFALVSFLWHFEPLTNEQITQSVVSYESDSGQWFVRTYSEALASALTVAGEEIATQISEIQ